MPLNFPASPVDGQAYDNWIYSSSKGAWLAKPLEPMAAVPSPTAPLNPTNGDMWYNTVDGTTYVWYDDGNTAQWVEMVAPISANGYYSPNYIINGGFDIWQRGTSFASTAGGRVFSADRWNHWRGEVDTTATYSRQSAGLTGFTYAMRVARNSGSTSTAEIVTDCDLESQHISSLIGKTVTLSFYARAGANYSSSGSIITTKLISGTGIDGRGYNGLTGSTNVVNTNSTLTTSWQRFTYTGTVSSSANQLIIQINYTPTGTAGANDYFEITGVQLEEGSTATPFRRNANSLQGELAACQRYYYRHQYESNAVAYNFGIVGWGRASSVGCWFTAVHPVKMRVAPSVSLTGTVRHEDYAGSVISIGAVNANFSTTSNLGLLLNRSSGAWGANTPGMMVFAAGDGYLEYSSEL